MRISPLQLEQYFVSELHFTVIPAFDPTKEAVMKIEHLSIDSSFIQDKADPKKWQLTLRIKHQPDASTNSAYAFTLELIGFFEVSKDFPEDTKERLVKTNAPTILYGIAREVLKTLTFSGPYPGVVIPSVSFYEPPTPVTQPKPPVPANPA